MTTLSHCTRRLGVLALLAALVPMTLTSQATPSRTYPQLVSLFNEWRAFEDGPRVAGIPDYTPVTNARRLAELERLRLRLQAVDTTGWPIAEQVDLHLVRAEMNGMWYQLTVLQPFARDPAFYASVRPEESDTPAEEGPTIRGVIRLWQYPVWPRTVLDTPRPLSADESRRLAGELHNVPTLLAQARVNLAHANARDLWIGGIRAFDEQVETLDQLRTHVGNGDPALLKSIADARAATASFTQWLHDESPKRTGPSGIGKEQYSWFLRNVLLMPLSWEDEITITRRELMRAHASLRLEETRNAALPPLKAADTPEEYAALIATSVPTMMAFLRDKHILTIEPWMERALLERAPGFAPSATRNFFAQGNHRDPLSLQSHALHWFDNGRFRFSPHPSPIRRTPLLYNVWMSRSEGMATALEEWFMQAGLYDNRPRGREVNWTMLAARAARGLGNLYAHSNELTMAEAGEIHMQWTPRGWMRPDPLLGFEQHLYLRQPGYGATYVTGGRLMEEVMALRARQLGDKFTMQGFMDEVNGVGMIPVSLIYWQLTGDDRMVRDLSRDTQLPPLRTTP